ncbi:hypothetical protein M427DRAFT_477164 [Gonapodya prolifera JEL478]|uniref:Uncharacterized protein n=1 Tax=Gonapodya prolifera (strain JEL478) TaxID=1344416 RepID=A0A139A133_GONPJ|nr:hypothetical protein M427DRAFT_477164 [Gonapodya prolifera JEL478]|eukprot:KXS10479.1 hypothetical protein M427DRAFT_477164 [Gonapodya prolifera JEL478]
MHYHHVCAPRTQPGKKHDIPPLPHDQKSMDEDYGPSHSGSETSDSAALHSSFTIVKSDFVSRRSAPNSRRTLLTPSMPPKALNDGSMRSENLHSYCPPGTGTGTGSSSVQSSSSSSVSRGRSTTPSSLARGGRRVDAPVE